MAPLALLLAPHCHAGWKFVPTIEARETYTDNLRLDSPALARSEWVSEVTPGFTLQNRGPRLRFDANYRLRYFDFPNDREEYADRTRSQLNARINAELVGELLYVDGAASITQQPISAFGPLLSDSAYATANRSQVRTFNASPYLRRRFGSIATAELRYVRDSVDTGRPGLGSSDGNTVSFSLASGRAFRDLGWNLQAREQRIDDQMAPETTTRTASLGLRYVAGRTLTLTASGGYDEYDYQALGGVTAGRAWSAGLSWTPGTRTRVDANVGKRYYGSSYFLSASHRTRKTVWSLNYNDAVTTTRSQFLLPSTIDTAAMLDRLFAATITDPAARQEAVEAYMRATGLPPSLADSVNYFSNRYFLQKQLQASAALRGARTRLVLSAFGTHRNALSTVEADSALLGPGSATLNDATRQIGASALWSLALNSRTAVNTTINATRVESKSTGLESTNKVVRLSLTRQFQRKLSGALELRRVTGPAGQGGEYRENAMVASLTMQL